MDFIFMDNNYHCGYSLQATCFKNPNPNPKLTRIK